MTEVWSYIRLPTLCCPPPGEWLIFSKEPTQDDLSHHKSSWKIYQINVIQCLKFRTDLFYFADWFLLGFTNNCDKFSTKFQDIKPIPIKFGITQKFLAIVSHRQNMTQPQQPWQARIIPYKFRWIWWLLMPLLLMSPGHQQSWHWHFKIGMRYVLVFYEKDLNYPCHFNVDKCHEVDVYYPDFFTPIQCITG